MSYTYIILGGEYIYCVCPPPTLLRDLNSVVPSVHPATSSMQQKITDCFDCFVLLQACFPHQNLWQVRHWHWPLCELFELWFSLKVNLPYQQDNSQHVWILSKLIWMFSTSILVSQTSSMLTYQWPLWSFKLGHGHLSMITREGMLESFQTSIRIFATSISQKILMLTLLWPFWLFKLSQVQLTLLTR